MFGYSVNFVDWTDLVLNLMELPNLSVDDLLTLNSRYSELEEKYKNDKDFIPGNFIEIIHSNLCCWFKHPFYQII